MTNLKISIYWLIALGAILASSCNDPTELGSELVEEDFSNIVFTDTVEVRTLTTLQDSIFTYTQVVANQPSTYLCGYLDDPIFGKSKADLYFNFIPSTNSTLSNIDFTDATFDSLVLSLGYNDFVTYGDTLLPQNLRVFRLAEEMPFDVDFYYSDDNFEVMEPAIGEKLDFLPMPTTAYVVNDSVSVNPRITIPLSSDLGMELMPTDTMLARVLYENTASFQAQFKGLKISPDENNSNILGFNWKSSLTYLRLYYTQNEVAKSFTYNVENLSTKFNEFNHDPSGSVSETFINDPVLSDSLVFVQGMSGYNVKVDFPDIQNLGNVVVNKAELEITFADLLEDDTTVYSHPDRLVLTALNSDGNYYVIEDVANAIILQDIDLYGGTPAREESGNQTLIKYRLGISNYLQNIIDDNLGGDNSVYIQVYLKNQLAQRGVFYGAGHSQYPLKLNLTYTKL